MIKRIVDTEEFKKLSDKLHALTFEARSKFVAKTRLTPDTLLVNEIDANLIPVFLNDWFMEETNFKNVTCGMLGELLNAKVIISEDADIPTFVNEKAIGVTVKLGEE